MPSLKTAIFAFSLLLISGGLAPAQTLSLDDCIRLALQKNPRLASAGYGINAAEQQIKAAGALRRPIVSFAAGASFAPLKGLDPALTEGGEYEGLVEIKQPLFDGTIKPAQQQAEVNLRQAANAKTRAAADIRLEVRLAYIDLLRTQRQYALTQGSITDLQSYLETVRALAYGGAVPKTDIARAEIQLQAETIVLNELRTAVAVAMKHLLEPMGLPLDTIIVVADSITLPAAPERFENNLDLKEFGFNLEAAKLDVKLAQAERLPVISAISSAGAWTSRNQLLEPGSPHIFGYLAGISFDLPIWNWGAIAARIEQKNAALNALQADFVVLRRRLDTAYQTSRQQYDAAVEKLSLLKNSHTKALEQYEILLAQYAGGGVSSLEVIDAHRTLLEIALQEEQTRAEIAILHAQMLRLTGETE
ncbi:MAG: TolC family protein [candidate division KSB1 bacterium]|nr:TolC family protein [candidate division KSB1 bacterium]MDZ7300647.1 TolC family protein [candidate division KSB1 bacterium]MDZ7309784.1 TolC family protein [candidate division KSB1 bacterium]